MTPTTVETQQQYITREIAGQILSLSTRRAGEVADEKKMHQVEARNPATGMKQKLILAADVYEESRLRNLTIAPPQQQSQYRIPPPQPQSAAAPVPQIAAPAEEDEVEEPATPEIRLYDHFPPAALLTVREAAAYLRAPRTYIVALVRSGALPSVKLPGGGIRIRRRDLDLLP